MRVMSLWKYQKRLANDIMNILRRKGVRGERLNQKRIKTDSTYSMEDYEML